MEKAIVGQYKWIKVVIGVPHLEKPGKLFYHFGILDRVTETHAILDIGTGYRKIPLEDIEEIRDDT